MSRSRDGLRKRVDGVVRPPSDDPETAMLRALAPLFPLGLLFAVSASAQLTHDALVPHGFGMARSQVVLFHPTEDLAVVTGQDLSLVAFDPGTGALEHLSTLLAVSAQIEIASGSDASGAWSADGAVLYRTWDNGLTVFALDTAEGSLRPIQVLEDGVDGVSPLANPRSITTTTDGKHLYVLNFDQVGNSGRAVVLFSRDPSTGLLSFQSALADDDGVTADGLSRAIAAALSPDDADLYVLTDSNGDNGIAHLDRDPITGELSFGELVTTGDVAALDYPRDLVVSPDGEHLYVACLNAGTVAVFDRDPATGALTFLDSESVQQAWALAIRPDGAFLTVLGRSPFALTVFARDPSTGLLTFVESVDDGDLGAAALGSDPRNLDYAPGGSILAVTGADGISNQGQVATLAVDAVSGALSLANRLSDQDPEAPILLRVTDAAFDPSGEHLVAVSEADGGVTVFGRAEIDGRLEVLQTFPDDGSGLGSLYSVAVSPDGLQVVVTGEDDGVGVVFDRDPVTGLLTPDSALPLDAGREHYSLRFASDEHLYGASGSDALVFYRRDPLTGTITLDQVLRDDVGGVDGLDIPEDIELSPDGRQIYVASSGDDAITVLDRDPTTGSVSFLDAEIQGAFGVDGLVGVRDLDLSPDGLFLYAVAPGSDALTIFSRHPVHGLLTFIDAIFHGVDLVEGLEDPLSVKLLDGGRLLVVGSAGRGGLAVFERDPVTGLPTLLSLPPSLDPGNGFERLVVAPGEGHLVALHYSEDALSVFALSVFADGFESGDTSAWSAP